MKLRSNVLAMLLMVALSAVGWAQDAPKITASTNATELKVGETYDGLMVVEFAPGLHGYQNPPSDPDLIPIAITSTDAVEVVTAQYPKGKVKTAAGIEAAMYEGTVKIPFKFKVLKELGSEWPPIRLSFQQCDDSMCYAPGEVDGFIKTGDASVQPVGATTTAPSGTNPTSAATTTTSSSGNITDNLKQAYENKEWLKYVGILFVIGLLINLTPCVYPMVPITMSFFGSQAKDNSGSRFALGFMYMLGIAITYGAIGGIAAATGAAFGDLFIKPWFNLLLGLFMFGLALSMFDLYQIGLPPVISRQLKGRSGPVGSLIMGLLLGFGAAPCAGPLIVGVFLLAAESKSPVFSIATFVLVGLGLGLPYMLLAAFMKPNSGVLPRAGNWMKVVKAVLGLLVIFFALDYFLRGLGTADTPQLRETAFSAFFGIGILVITFYEIKSLDRNSFILKALAIATLGILLGTSIVKQDGPKVAIKFEPFTQESWQAAIQSGKPIFIDAGANWCTECKEIEHRVFTQPEAIEATKDFVRLKIDWSTGVDEKYKQETAKQFNIVGLPHMVVAKPGGEVVAVFNELKSVAELKEHLSKSSQ